MMPQRKEPIYTPPGGPAAAARPDPSIYPQMGQDNIFRMLEDFYRELERSPIASMFPRDMVAASRRSAAFFVQLLGGPPMYIELYGPPMMRARHLPFLIDEHARQVWLECFRRVLADAPARYNFPPEHLPGFIRFLEAFSSWMVNVAPDRDDATPASSPSREVDLLNHLSKRPDPQPTDSSPPCPDQH